MGQAKYHIEKKCPICGQIFRAKTLYSTYCSRVCSDAAYRKKRRAKAYQAMLDSIEESISEKQEYLSVKEAVSVYGVSRETLYRLIRNGRIPSVNIGRRLIRVKREELEQKFEHRAVVIAKKDQPIPKSYRLEPEDCYTIGQVSERFNISPTTVYTAIRQYSIPMRQIGRYVYVPKSEINKIFKSVNNS